MVWYVYKDDTIIIGDDAARTAEVRTPDGALIQTRPFTAEENATAAAAAAAETARADREAARVAVRAIVTDVKVEMDRVQPIIDTGSGDSLKLARATKRIGAAVIDLARLVKDL